MPQPLEQLVAERRADPPTAAGVLPMPARLFDADLDVGAAPARMRNEERW